MPEGRMSFNAAFQFSPFEKSRKSAATAIVKLQTLDFTAQDSPGQDSPGESGHSPLGQPARI